MKRKYGRGAKRALMPNEKNLLLWTLKKTILLRNQKGPITEDPKENLINEKSKEDTIAVTPIDNPINKDSQELHDPQ